MPPAMCAGQYTLTVEEQYDGVQVMGDVTST
jgi:hypothetical protein